MTDLPSTGAGALESSFPNVWQCYQALGRACSEAGPLDSRTRRLLKLALALGAASEGAVHSHVRQALDDGISPQEIRHVALLAITTLGFPAAMAGFSWVNDILKD